MSSAGTSHNVDMEGVDGETGIEEEEREEQEKEEEKEEGNEGEDETEEEAPGSAPQLAQGAAKLMPLKNSL